MDLDNDDSDDVRAFEVKDTADASNVTMEDRPIMLLFKKLIGNDNRKKKMLLTDAQIKEMLKIEFDIDMDFLHGIEVDIFLAVTKKFLKSWPQWNSFNTIVNGLQTAQDYSSLKKVYDKKYVQFKDYLGTQLEATKPLAQEAARNVMQKNNVNTKSSDLVLEIVCSRSHLNQLIYRQPVGERNSIFCGTENVPTQISLLNEHSLESILNWWSVTVSVNLNILLYKRQTTHELEHWLINNTRKEDRLKNIKLDQDPMVRSGWIKKDTCDKGRVINTLEKIKLQYTNNIKAHYLIETVFKLIMDDVKNLPNYLKIPGDFKQYSNKYKYVRYLNAPQSNAGSDQGTYDIQLQETVAPMQQFSISKAEMPRTLLPPFEQWFLIECGLCNEVFSGEMTDNLLSHFNMHHQNEPDWTCCNCRQTFKMIQLAKFKWYHEC